jgi:putative (di)nucleoside polyphosphate hydrolase
VSDLIDSEGFRANVGIIVSDDKRALLLGGRVGQSGWQFPQGGILESESPEQAMYRELEEEIGLLPEDVEVLGSTSDWLSYRLPDRYIRRNSSPLCIGQKQRWFLLRLLSDEDKLQLDRSELPEFDRWRWVDFWRPVKEVIYFKRRVYVQALDELAPLLFPEGAPPQPQWWPDKWRHGDPE